MGLLRLYYFNTITIDTKELRHTFSRLDIFVHLQIFMKYSKDR